MRALVLGLALCLTLASPAWAVRITVDLSDQMMTVDTGSGFLGSYRWKVSTARSGYVTPKGKFRPYLMKKMHYSRKYDNAPMPHSIFYHGGYAIHATPHVKSLGRPASHGCVRLSPQNAKMLYWLVQQAGMKQTSIRIVPLSVTRRPSGTCRFTGFPSRKTPTHSDCAARHRFRAIPSGRRSGRRR